MKMKIDKTKKRAICLEMCKKKAEISKKKGIIVSAKSYTTHLTQAYGP